MRVSQQFDAYNARRYSKPRIAIVTAWPIGGKPQFKFGGWIGNDRDGGEAEIDAQPGDIARWGQADHRGNKTDNLWGIVQDDGAILRVSETEARKHWTQLKQAAADTTAIEIAPIDKTAIEIAEPVHPVQHTLTPGTREIDPRSASFIQSRAQMDFALIDEYAQMMRDGVEFDAAQGIEDANGAIYIYDGYHRGKAAEHINATLRVSVQPGTRQDAEWLAFGANVKHGLRRTHDDIERVVKHALQHPNAATKSDREIARHCGVDNKTVGNWRKRLERDAAAQRDDDTPSEEIPQSRNAATQTEIAGTERAYTIEEIEDAVTDYISATPYNEQIAILKNIILRTVSGMAYTREIQSHLTRKSYVDNAYYAAVKAVQTRLKQATCDTCGFVGERQQMFQQDGRWYCSKCYLTAQTRKNAVEETATAQEIEDIENAVMAKLPQNDLALDALREVMLNTDAFDRLRKQMPGFPAWLIHQAINNLHNRLTLARALVNKTPTRDDEADAKEIEEIIRKAGMTPASEFEEISKPEPQMRCVGCRVEYPANKLTYKTGLCEACLNDQLERLAADSRLMRAVFAVIDRRAVSGLEADLQFYKELKRDIYEEIYAPTPEPQTCEACGKTFPADQITEYNGRKLHTDCYYAEMTSALKAYDAPEHADGDTPPDPRERVLYYKAKGLSVRKIADALKGEGITISKSAVDRIIQDNKEAQA